MTNLRKLTSQTLIAVALVAFIGAPSWAAKNKACAGVWKACKSAGKKKKDLKACVETIKGGGTVDGVTVSDADLKSCQGGGGASDAPKPDNGT